MSNEIGAKLLSGLRKIMGFSSLKTPHASNAGLTRLNGSAKLFNGEWRDVIINGSASLGSSDVKTNFEGVIVVNGSAQVINSSFSNLEVNGSANLENARVENTFHINGNAVLNGCTIERLVIYGKRTTVKLKGSTIRSEERID